MNRPNTSARFPIVSLNSSAQNSLLAFPFTLLFFRDPLCVPLANSCFHDKPYPENSPNCKMKVDYHEVDKTIEKILACEKVPNITAQFVEVYSFEILDLGI